MPLPDDVAALYREARRCVAAGSHTAAVLVCRKILMHLAVEKGARQGDDFVAYVQHLADHGYIPPNSRGWVDHIRARGNEANHKINIMQQSDAVSILDLVEMLLKIIYEFPKTVPSSTP